MKKAFVYKTAVGPLTLAEKDGYVTDLIFEQPSGRVGPFLTEETPLLKKAATQLSEYFNGIRKVFELPLNPAGTEFEQKVWKALCDIPYGETRTYGDVALRIGNPRASRAVGRANNHNPIAIFIPCHRVIGANGNLVGYAGGLDTKAYLLRLEKSLLL